MALGLEHVAVLVIVLIVLHRLLRRNAGLLLISRGRLLDNGVSNSGIDPLTFPLNVVVCCVVVIRVKNLEHLVGGTLVSCLQKHVNVDREFDGVSGWSRAEVVLAGLEAVPPRVEVHGGHLTKHRVSLVKIQGLRLADVGATADS